MPLDPNDVVDGGYMLGIDEAGRGPVLGPMVYGIAFCPINKANQLKEMGFADSKTLNHIEREEYRLQIEQSDIMGWQVDIIMPQYLSGRMLRHNKYNLNFISHDSAIALVHNTIARGFNIQQVYVDTVGDPVKYQVKLKAIFPSIQIIVAKKADSLYPIVSAASICAKTTRDRVLFEWQFPEAKHMKISRDFGSGYPGDPKTKSWLLTHNHRVFGFPAIVRFSWSTAKTIMKTQSCAVIWPEEYEDESMRHNAFKACSEKENNENICRVRVVRHRLQRLTHLTPVCEHFV